MSTDEKNIEKYKVTLEFFKNMEQRYRTWMNYYSLFNGALFVAFCTILISTGKIIETEGVNTNTKSFLLDCTYWDLLTLIAIIGVIAAYCWYLSLIGHYNWINSWRNTLKNFSKELGWDLKDPNLRKNTCCLCWGKKSKQHFHSTQKVTKCFVLVVLWAWIWLTIYSQHHFTHNEYSYCCLLLLSVHILIILICFEYIAHVFLGSDVSEFDTKDQNKEGSNGKIIMPLVFFVIALSSLLFWT